MNPRVAARYLYKWYERTSKFTWIVFPRQCKKYQPDRFEVVKQAANDAGLSFPAYVHQVVFNSGLCRSCRKQTTWIGMEDGFRPWCSLRCSGQSEERKAKAIATNLKRYGSRGAHGAPEIAEKRRKTWRKKYGVDHPFHNPKVKAKQTATWAALGGPPMTRASTRKKRAKTLIDRYGSTDPTQAPGYWARREATCIERHGVRNVMQNAAIHSHWHSTLATKKTARISGRTFSLPGYELIAVKHLVKIEGVSVKSIVDLPEKMPEIWYECVNGKQRRYFADLLIGQRIIEIKSTFTLTMFNVREKLLAAKKKRGFSYEIMVMSPTGTLLKRIKTARQYDRYVSSL